MAYLPFISDEDFLKHVASVLDVGIKKNLEADETFHRNVIDPFGPIFESAVKEISLNDWVKQEKQRQGQKTLQNAIGSFHQNILGSVPGWNNLDTGEQYDLVNDQKTIIAEIKNKYHTVKGSDEIGYYKGLDNLVNNKNGQYNGATAYFVRVIPKNPTPFDVPFTPSDNEKGKRAPVDANIRDIDGRSFYALVTGVDDALDQLHEQIPHAILALEKNGHTFSEQDFDTLGEYFTKAYAP